MRQRSLARTNVSNAGLAVVGHEYLEGADPRPLEDASFGLLVDWLLSI